MVNLDDYVFTEPRIKNRSPQAIELPWRMGAIEATVTFNRFLEFTAPEAYWLVVPKEIDLV